MKKERETVCINLFGGPGAGKSTSVAGIFSLLKLHGVECELVTEFAKDLVWEERSKTFGDQHYIFGKQHHRMWRLKDKVDVIITDSPLLLSVVYRPKSCGPGFYSNVIEAIKTFTNFNYVINRVKPYNPNSRNETKEEAGQIDIIIKNELEKNNMDWREVKGDYKGINKITNDILGMLGKELNFKIKENNFINAV